MRGISKILRIHFFNAKSGNTILFCVFPYIMGLPLMI